MTRAQISRINSRNAGRRGFWTAGRVAILRREWPLGVAVAEIAELIGAGCTRNQVIGKANRLGLRPRDSAQFSRNFRPGWRTAA